MIGPLGLLELLREVAGKFDLQPAGQCGLPGHEIPFPTPLAVYTALDKRPFNLDLGFQQVLPLVPRAIPIGVEAGRIEPELKLATHIAAQCPVLVESAPAQRDTEPPPEFRGEPDDAASKEGFSVTRRLSGSQQRAESSIGK